jgi:hypothetical protein
MPDALEFEKVSVAAAKATLEKNSRRPAGGESDAGGTPQPQEALQPTTVAWVATLPDFARPVALLQSYPRVANEICTLWRRVARCEEYLDGLLIDRRGGRAGFPLAVATELTALRNYYATLHPSSRLPWDIVEKSR